jgi:DNA-binding GntR family transcriptional regulator
MAENIMIKKRPLYSEEIKKALLDAILSGELQPGDRIVETRWARKLGVSQSPIREAIRELETTGVVENIPYKGCVVRKVSKEEIENVFKVRIALESMAVEEDIRRGTDEMIRDLKDELDTMISAANDGDVDRFILGDVSFHEIIVNHAKNDVLLRLWKQCGVIDNTHITTMVSGDSIVDLAKRHEEIYNALKEDNVDLAKEAIRRHFQMLIEGIPALDD